MRLLAHNYVSLRATLFIRATMKEITPTEAANIISWINQPGQSEVRERLEQSDEYYVFLEKQIIDNWFAPVIIIHALVEKMTAKERKTMWSYVRAKRYRQKQRDKKALVPVYVSKDTAKKLQDMAQRLSTDSSNVSDDEVLRYLINVKSDHNYL
jgi:hypothetical protein